MSSGAGTTITVVPVPLDTESDLDFLRLKQLGNGVLVEQETDPQIAVDERLADHPAVAEIRERLSRALPFEFWANIDLFQEIARSDLAIEAVRLGLGRIRENADYQLPAFTMEGLVKGWRVLQTPYFGVSVGYRAVEWGGLQYGAPVPSLAERPSCRPQLQPYPFDIFIAFLRARPFESDLYRVREADADGVPRGLERMEKRSMAAGDSLALHAGIDVAITRHQGAYVYLEISSNPAVAILPRFDAETKLFSGWISGDPAASRIELLTRTLAEFRFADGAPVIEAISRHRDHHVRWNAMRHLLRLEPAQGALRISEAAVEDCHPEVRLAARETLSLINALEE